MLFSQTKIKLRSFEIKKPFLPMLFQAMILMLKFSPEYLLISQNQYGQFGKLNTYILQLFNSSKMFMQVSVGLITLGLIFSLLLVFLGKKGITQFQVISSFFFPVQLYLALSLVNRHKQGYFYLLGCLTQIQIKCRISFVIMIFKNFFLDLRTNSLFVVKTFSKKYQILSDGIILISMTLSFFINPATRTSIVISLLFLTVIKSIIVFKRINFESPLMEYTAYICEPLSWVSVMAIFLEIFYGISMGVVLWGYSVLIIFCLINENYLVREMLEKKYIDFLKSECIAVKNNEHNFQERENNLIIYLSIIKEALKTNDQESKKEPFLSFSQEFIHKLWTLIVKMDEGLLKSVLAAGTENEDEKRELIQHQASSSISNCNSRMDVNILNFIKTGALQLKSLSQQSQRYWSIVKSLKQLQNQKSQRLRRYLCYNLPQINNLFQTRIIYLHYLSHQADDRKQSLYWSSKDFVSQLHKELDYEYVMQRSKFKHYNKFFVKMDHKHPTVIGKKREEGFQYCLQHENQYGSRYYEDFYKQTIIQETLEKLFAYYIKTQTQIIQTIESKQSTIHKIVPQLFNLHQLKTNVTEAMSKSQNHKTHRYIIQHYILSKYILKMPQTAKEELKMLQDLKDQHEFKGKISPNPHRISSKSINKKEEAESHAVFMISAVQKKGNVVYVCDNFRNLVEIKSEFTLTNETNHEALNINHLMLPCWIQKHNEVMQSFEIYQKPFHHIGQKYHIKSLISKNIYEVSFTVHFITCNKDDLLMAMDVVYSKLDYLSIYKGSHRVFYRNVIQSKSLSDKTLAFHKTDDHGMTVLSQHCNLDEVFRYEDMIFGQCYKITCVYTNNGDDEKIQTASMISYMEECHRLESTVDNFAGPQFDKQLEIEQKLAVYRKSHFFLKKDFFRLLCVNFSSLIILVVSLILLSNFIASENIKHDNLYDFKYTVQNQFYITDLKSFTSFNMLFLPINAYVRFASNSSIIDFQNLWYTIFLQEIGNLEIRSSSVSQNPSFVGYITKMPFNSEKIAMPSFLYSEEKFDVQFFDIFRNLPINKFVPGNMSTFPNPKRDLTKIQLNQLVSFYVTSMYRYEDYVSEGGIFNALEGEGNQMIDDQKHRIMWIFNGLLLVIVTGALTFVLLYFRYLLKIYKFVQSLYEFPEMSLKAMKSSVANLKCLIYQARSSSYEYNPYKTIQTSRTLNKNNRTVLIRTHSNYDKIEPIQRYRLFYNNWKQIALVLLFIVCCLTILYLANQEADNEIDTFRKYLDGSQKLADLLGNSIYVFTQLVDGIFSITRPLNPEIPQILSQIKAANRLKIMQMIEPNKQKAHANLFDPWPISFAFPNSFSSLRQNWSLTEVISRSIQLYQQVYNKLFAGPEGIIIDSFLVVKMYKQLSRSTTMIRSLLGQAQKNYYSEVTYVQEYLAMTAAWIGLFCGGVFGVGMYKLYHKAKIVFDQTLSLTTINHLLHVPVYAVLVKQSKRQNMIGQI